MSYKSYRKEVESKMQSVTKQALETVGLEGQRDVTMKITDNKQVDTGRMRASISYIVGSDSVHVGTNVEYAPYQEKMKPYLTPAIKNNLGRYSDIISDMFARLM